VGRGVTFHQRREQQRKREGWKRARRRSPGDGVPPGRDLVKGESAKRGGRSVLKRSTGGGGGGFETFFRGPWIRRGVVPTSEWRDPEGLLFGMRRARKIIRPVCDINRS